jgi:hypothetical protein
MWQTVIVLGMLTVVLIYVIRHYVKIFRAEAPSCSGCTGCCSGNPASSCEEAANPPVADEPNP